MVTCLKNYVLLPLIVLCLAIPLLLLAVSPATALKPTRIEANNITVTYGSGAPIIVEARLLSDNTSVPGREITVSILGHTLSATTDENGEISVDLTGYMITVNPGVYETSLSFSGDSEYEASEKTVYLTIEKAFPP